MSTAAPTILVINPGSTSTRIALFKGTSRIDEQYRLCPTDELKAFKTLADQASFRTRQVHEFLSALHVEVNQLDAIAARGGPMAPVPGGVYRVNQDMLDDATGDGYVEHISRIACVIADRLARESGAPAFIVDPPSVDEYDALSRISGLMDLPRRSIIHALNVKRVCRVYAQDIRRNYEDLNLISVHLGGGITVAIHKQGRMIDSLDANGEGPFSPERSGGLRVDELCRHVIEKKMTYPEARSLLTRRSGLVSHLGTVDAIEIEKRIEAGDAEAALVYEAMAYTVSKAVCALSAAVSGKIDAVVITGGLARSEMMVRWITERVSFLGPVAVYPGEKEIEALRDGVLRVLQGKENVKVYPTGEFE